MSGGLAPSKSTVYVSNLPFSLTNNDLHKVFEKYGKVVKVTIVKDKDTHRSKGFAFILFLERESAYQCIRAVNGVEMFGRTLKCSIAKDNGRAAEFIRRKEYKDKTKCYECGEEGHLSYKCPKNLFGERQPPPKKERKRKRARQEEEYEDSDESDGKDDEQDAQEEDSLAAAIRYEQEKVEEEDYRYRVATGNYTAGASSSQSQSKKVKYKKDAYFSDEEDVEDD